jgi:hypothetical protein
MARIFIDPNGHYFQAYSSDRPFGKYAIVVDEEAATVYAKYARSGPNSITYNEIRPMKLSPKSALNFADILRWKELV